jgi:hypothetical protein
MFELKRLSPEAVPRSIEKAERYRLLNEPAEAESICLDVLRVDADNQQALVVLLLALSDQLDEGVDVGRLRELLPRLRGEYERAYYAGIVCERRAKAQWRRGGPGSSLAAHDGLREAMEWYEKASALRPPDNEDAALRWNACARMLMDHPQLQPAREERVELPLE